MAVSTVTDNIEELSSEEVGRYSRHILLPEIGIEGQKKLKRSRVLVVGAGGLGSPSLLYLAAAGVGTIGIADFDVVDESNLQRQVIHTHDRIGESKAESAKKSILSLNPYINVLLHEERIDRNNAVDLFKKYDLILDGTDNFATRYLVNDACVLAEKPYVWGSIYRFEGQASVFWEQAPDGKGINYRDLYPAPPPPEHAPSCSEGGVLGILCASIASIMATEAIKLITGIGNSLIGRLAVYDALDMDYRFIPIRKLPNREPVTELADYEYFCGLKSGLNEAQTSIPEIDVAELKSLVDIGADFTILDVREQGEVEIVALNESINISQKILMSKFGVSSLNKRLNKSDLIVVYCKAGSRSRKVSQILLDNGFEKVKNLKGGILAWIDKIDPSLPKY